MGQLLLAFGLNFGMNSVTLIQVPGDPDGFLSADQPNWLIAATSLGGMLGGLMGAPVAIPEGCVRGYVSEIVPPKRRALFSALSNFMICLGQVLVVAVAPLLHWQVLFIVVGVVPAALCLSGLLFLPNSAKWLLSGGHSEEEAVRSIQFFRGTQVDAAAEVCSIHDSLQHAHADGAALPMWTLLRQPGTWRPLSLVFIQMVLLPWCGSSTLMLITAFVLASVRLPLSEYQRAMLPAALAAVVSVPGGMIIERYGRLPVLRLGGVLSAIGCAAVAAYFFLAPESHKRLGWIVLAGAGLTQVAVVGMLANVAFNYVTELLPNKTRALGANIVLVVLNLNVFVLLKLYPLIRDGIGLGGGFVIHSLVSLCQVFFATFCLKETKGLSLEQIQHLF
ncbi:solute carrier family 2, facilitated glucose transporter member 6-like [Pollicipes pollicipes]|uniref:solute carrier family 2, facilitated glucose transporter member 6-like n=1 Tax=Pollicipes pollicipes TaxID=41117 RepID=UPI0018854E72|nr:solute carrier family 2, facilitated glucose transporter member 6-like [Pollicipes pollicipes]